MTFSLIARDPETGMFGISMATTAIAVGNRCPWVRTGIGAVTTQHRTDIRSGLIGLDMLSRGYSAQETVNHLAASNEYPQERQFAAVDNKGRSAFYNGPEIEANHAGFLGDGCVSTGNFIANNEVPQAIVEAYEAARGASFVERLLIGIEAGLAAGGETKPINAAALLVADREAWPLVDLRIDWAEEPLTKMRRLWEFYEPHQERFVKQVLAPRELSLLVGSPMNV